MTEELLKPSSASSDVLSADDDDDGENAGSGEDGYDVVSEEDVNNAKTWVEKQER